MKNYYTTILATYYVLLWTLRNEIPGLDHCVNETYLKNIWEIVQLNRIISANDIQTKHNLLSYWQTQTKVL